MRIRHKKSTVPGGNGYGTKTNRKDSVIMSIAQLEVEVKQFTCKGCGLGFTEDEGGVYTETHGFTEGPFEYFLTCPACGCGNLSRKGGLPWLNL